MRKTLFFAVAFLSLLAVLEVCSFIATGFLEKKGAIYRVPSASRQEYAEYLSTRDAHLGWLLPQQSEAFRPSPAYSEGENILLARPFTEILLLTAAA